MLLMKRHAENDVHKKVSRKRNAIYRNIKSRADRNMHQRKTDRNAMFVINDSIKVAVGWVIVVGYVPAESKVIMDIIDDGGYRNVKTFLESTISSKAHSKIVEFA